MGHDWVEEGGAHVEEGGAITIGWRKGGRDGARLGGGRGGVMGHDWVEEGTRRDGAPMGMEEGGA